MEELLSNAGCFKLKYLCLPWRKKLGSNVFLFGGFTYQAIENYLVKNKEKYNLNTDC